MKKRRQSYFPDKWNNHLCKGPEVEGSMASGGTDRAEAPEHGSRSESPWGLSGGLGLCSKNNENMAKFLSCKDCSN